MSLDRYLRLFERFALLGVVVGSVFKLMHWVGGNDFLLFSMAGLAIIYFLGAFVPPPSAPQNSSANSMQLLIAMILQKVLGIGSATGVIGILFAVMHMPGSREMLLIGSMTLTVAVILGAYFTITDYDHSKGNMPMLIRAGTIGLLGWLALFRVIG